MYIYNFKNIIPVRTSSSNVEPEVKQALSKFY